MTSLVQIQKFHIMSQSQIYVRVLIKALGHFQGSPWSKKARMK